MSVLQNIANNNTNFLPGSQAFGAGRKLQFGTLTIRALLMSLTCCCYIVVIWFFSCDLFASFNDSKLLP